MVQSQGKTGGQNWKSNPIPGQPMQPVSMQPVWNAPISVNINSVIEKIFYQVKNCFLQTTPVAVSSPVWNSNPFGVPASIQQPTNFMVKYKLIN